jgi:tRNA threonylcarbamoyladenosine biosynthesis protein TsaE
LVDLVSFVCSLDQIDQRNQRDFIDEALVEKVVLQTKNPAETIRIGKHIGRLLLPGDVVALVGELGTGKTQFVKGLAAGVGIGTSADISSPSFTLINEYGGKVPLYHIDLFRLKSEREAGGLGLEEYFRGGGITVVEWADKIPSFLPPEMLWLQIRYTGERARSFEITAKGKRYEEILKKFGVRSGE